jgi:UDP-glucose 4-epimerase
MSWLITGGAGYIGAHVVAALRLAGHRVVVFDDLSTGAVARVPAEVPRVFGSVLDDRLLRQVVDDHEVDGIIHLAAKKKVTESVHRPLFYYRENLEGLRVLLDVCRAAGVRRFVFSSSAAVYGDTDVEQVTEDTPCRPVNPYGETKLAGEWLVRATANSTDLGFVILRYFNVAGAGSPTMGDVGVNNLIPMVFEALANGGQPTIFGADYPTFDGTCIRDFIHVADLATAHVAAAQRLSADADARLTLNVGRGRGASVREIIGAIGGVTGGNVNPRIHPRRVGDPTRVVASVDRIVRELGWRSRFGIRDMIESAWEGWCRLHPEHASLGLLERQVWRRAA